MQSIDLLKQFLKILYFRIISLREKLSNLKHQVEMLMQSLGNSSAAEPTGFLEQNETLKTSPSEKTEMNIARVHLDEKTEVCKKNSALKYV